MKDLIKKMLKEAVDNIISCNNCKWSWKKSESGPDMYFCHKCGTDNTPDNIREERKNKSVGILIKCDKTDKILLLLRNDKTPRWSLVSGSMEDGENPIDCLNREIKEELSIDPSIIKIKKIGIEDIKDKDMIFHYYEGLTSEEFKPKLDDENSDWGWFSKQNLPSPLYRGMSEKIKNI